MAGWSCRVDIKERRSRSLQRLLAHTLIATRRNACRDHLATLIEHNGNNHLTARIVLVGRDYQLALGAHGILERVTNRNTTLILGILLLARLALLARRAVGIEDRLRLGQSRLIGCAIGGHTCRDVGCRLVDFRGIRATIVAQILVQQRIVGLKVSHRRPIDLGLLLELNLALQTLLLGLQLGQSLKIDVDTLHMGLRADDDLRGEEEDSTFQNALDAVMDSIERQLRKNKTKLEKRLREGVFPKEIEDEAIEEQETVQSTDAPVRIKEFVLKPMSTDEAILQMNMLGHQFFVYLDEQTLKTCVVYQRKDGLYGLIVPKTE